MFKTKNDNKKDGRKQKAKLESLSDLLKSQLNVEKLNIVEIEKEMGLSKPLET